MSNYPHPIIAREGWPFVAGSFALALAVTIAAGWLWAIFFWLVAFFILQFFRDPPRPIPPAARAVLVPADGQVVTVERTNDPYLRREAIKVSVFMNVFNVHSNRSPVDGIVREIWYHAGLFVNASLSKASLENERNALWIKMADGTDITCVQVAGLIARGQRYGFIRFGSRVDVYLPTTATPRVAVGDKVYASATILAELA